MKRFSLILFLLSAPPLRAEVRTLLDFEAERDLAAFELKQKSGRLVSDGTTHGSRALEISNGEYLTSWREPPCGDWSGFDVLRFDADNRTGAPVRLYILIGDKAWRGKNGGTYWNRHNSYHTLPPGKSTFTLPIKGLFRGEAGSRNNAIKENIDISNIVRLDLGFKGQQGKIIIDWLRLESAETPEGITALDFGPEDQPVYPGFRPITWNTLWDSSTGLGFHPRRRPWGKNRGRDDTFPPDPLFRDFVESGGCTFSLKVKPGKNVCWLVFNDCGYWGGEQARHRTREIIAEGTKVYSEQRPLGWAAALYKFEDKETLPGCDMWNQYMKEIFKPVRFEVDVADGVLDLDFKADAPWSCKVAALIVFPEDIQAEGDEFISTTMRNIENTFRQNAVETPLPHSGVPSNERPGSDILMFPVSKDRDVFPNTLPSEDDIAEDVRLLAFRGEKEPFTFALRATARDEDVTVSANELDGPGTIPASNLKIWVVKYLGKRGFNSISWQVKPWHMLPGSSFRLQKGITRQVWVDITVPEDARPGTYKGIVSVQTSSGTALKRPFTLEVMPGRLHGTDFVMGFYGVTPPARLPQEDRRQLQEQIFAILRDTGMTSFAGGPDYYLKGFRNGEPVLDFSAVDEFMAMARRHGFRLPANGYGGLSLVGLYDRNRYVKGEIGRKLERETGLSYEEICRRTWKAVLEHAEEKRWLPFYVAMCDETRVVELAREQLELMRLFRKVAPDLLIAGSYSVSFEGPPKNALERLHREFFETLRVNMLNRHDRSVIDKAKALGCDLFIYNQGRDRFTFGFYQWAEYSKGVKGRYQWHLFPLHGFQYFDLDGREPDNGVICYHSRYGVIPTIALMRIREGVDDFLYLQTLSDLVKTNPRHPSTGPGKRLLEKIEDGIGVNERSRPEWLDMDRFREMAARLIASFRED